MRITQTNKAKFLIMTVIILIGLFSVALMAQDKEKSDSKLDQLKGKVEKITVKVDGKDVVFDGAEAQKLADKLREEKRFKIISSGNLQGYKRGPGRVMVFRSEGDDDNDIKTVDIKKMVKLDDKDGKKVVTVTTTKDGKEETKTYEGEEAEKMMNSVPGSAGKLRALKEGNGKVMIVRVEGKDDDSDGKDEKTTKKINVEDKDGKKVVTITTTTDGKEETKVYEGEDAEKFLKDGEGSTRVWISKNGDKRNMDDNVFYFKRRMENRRMKNSECGCCCGRAGMRMHMRENDHNKIIIKKMDKDDDDSDVVMEKKERKEKKEIKEQKEKKEKVELKKTEKK